MSDVRGERRSFCCTGCEFVYRFVGGGEPGGSAASWFLIMLGLSAVLSGFIMTFSFVFYLHPDLPAGVRDLLHYILLALATPVIFGVGYTYLDSAARELLHGRLSMASLIALGTVSAYSYSAYLTLHHAPHVYFDSATMVIVLVTVGRFLQARTRARAALAMRAYAAQIPREAHRVIDGEEEAVTVDAIRPGDTIRVRPGEMIPVDGKIREGRTTVDESLLTGESLPVGRGVGECVFQGTINLDGVIAVEALQTGEGTLQAQIERLLTNAVAARMPLQALVDRVSSAFVACTLILAVGVFTFYSMRQEPANGLLNALSILVVACPCALGLATPLAAFVSLQRAAREGVLIRSIEILEKLSQVDTMVFDKTGTLTEGKLSVEEVDVSSSSVAPDKLLQIAASLENCSEHHLGRAILQEWRERSSEFLPVSDFVNHPGEGIEGLVALRSPADVSPTRVYLGTAASLQSRGLRMPADLGVVAPGEGFGTVVFIGWEDLVRGAIVLRDRLRAGAEEMIEQCLRMHLDAHLLSGDRVESTRPVAAALGITKWAGERLPAQKVEYVAELQRRGRHVAMVGDGINDAPALAQADAGFTHQFGSDLSREAADIHILSGKLAGAARSVSLARKTFRHIRQNLFWAFFYNVIAMGLAAMGWLRPVMAAAAMLLSSTIVVGNSLRVGKTKKSDAATAVQATPLSPETTAAARVA